MNWKSHLIIGIILNIIIISALIYFFNFNIKITFPLIMIVLISPLVPDLDHRLGKLRSVLLGVGLLIMFFGFTYNSMKTLFLGFLLCVLLYMNNFLFKHRGFWHSIPMGFIYGLSIYFLTNDYILGTIGFIGFWSHLILDGCSFKLW